MFLSRAITSGFTITCMSIRLNYTFLFFICIRLFLNCFDVLHPRSTSPLSNECKSSENCFNSCQIRQDSQLHAYINMVFCTDNGMRRQLDCVRSNYDKIILMWDLNFNYNFDDYLAIWNEANARWANKSNFDLLDDYLTCVLECHRKTAVCNISISDYYTQHTVLICTKDKAQHIVSRFENFKSFDIDVFLNYLRSNANVIDTAWSFCETISKWTRFKECLMSISNKVHRYHKL